MEWRSATVNFRLEQNLQDFEKFSVFLKMGMCLACLSGEKDDYQQPSPVRIKRFTFNYQLLVITRVILFGDNCTVVRCTKHFAHQSVHHNLRNVKL